MELSRQTRDRIVAAIGAFALVAIVFGAMFIAKSCGRRCTVKYFDGDELLRTEIVMKGDKIVEWVPENKDDKQFDCWENDKGVKYYFDKEVSGDVNLYVRWKAVSQDENGESQP